MCGWLLKCKGVRGRRRAATAAKSQGIGACARSNDIEATDVDYNRASAAQNVGVMPSVTRSEGALL